MLQHHWCKQQCVSARTAPSCEGIERELVLSVLCVCVCVCVCARVCVFMCVGVCMCVLVYVYVNMPTHVKHANVCSGLMCISEVTWFQRYFFVLECYKKESCHRTE